jgi:hypothetical protein
MRLAHILVCHSVDPAKLFNSIPHRDDNMWHVFFHGSDMNLFEKVKEFVCARNGKLYPYMENRGLATSWNEGILYGIADECEAVLILNDDLFFYPEGYHQFRETIETIARSRNDVSFITPFGLESGGSPHAGEVIAQAFACCAMSIETFGKVGYFDENFWPAYYEDTDWDRRAILLKLFPHADQRVLVEHERSLTSRINPDIQKQTQINFQINEQYYIRKWGGLQGRETFSTPFNNPTFDPCIPAANRNAPYGLGYDRVKS